MDKDDAPPRSAPAGWVDAMDESDADLAAGRVVPFAEVQAGLRASIARLEALAGANPASVPARRSTSNQP